MLTMGQQTIIRTAYYYDLDLPEDLDQELIHGRNLYTFTPDGSHEDVLIFFE